MEYWILWNMPDAPDQVRAVARAAESMGYTGIALADHVALPKDFASVHPSIQSDMQRKDKPVRHDHPFWDPFVTSATMAAVTTTLRFTSYIYVLPMRDPFSVAKQVATVAMQSDYRFDLCVGAGWNAEEIELLGHDFSTRGARMDEMIATMRDLWDDGMASLHGKFYSFDDVGQFPVPQRHIPLRVGGKSDAALRRAARHDGWAGMKYPIEETTRLIRKLKDERQRYLDAGNPDSGCYRNYILHTDLPSREIFDTYEALGFDGILAVPFARDLPSGYDGSTDAKLEAMQSFMDRYVR